MTLLQEAPPAPSIPRARPSRVQTVLGNLMATRIWQPRDLANWYHLVRPLARLARTSPGFASPRMAYEMATRIAFGYQPLPATGRPPLGMDRPGPTRSVPDRPHVALFVDSPDHISGVATTLRQWAAAAEAGGYPLDIYHAGSAPMAAPSICFEPVGTIGLAAYAGLTLQMPRVLEVQSTADRCGFDVAHLSTPGPMGLLGLILARDRGLPVVGTYPTDFPRYARDLTDDPAMAEVAWDAMRWFYGQMDRVAAPSSATRDDLIAHGLDPARVAVVGRGIDTSTFSPAHRREELRRAWHADRPHKILYVGRVSEEKNLSCLTKAFRMLAAARRDVALTVVGDGPYLRTMRADLEGLPVTFTGFLACRELAEAYASADLFAFPSETDTFGVVLLEAQASGLPVVVSGQGGPRDCVADGMSGRILDPMTPGSLARAIDAILSAPATHAAMREAAEAHATRFTPEASFQAFWGLHREFPQHLITS